MKIVNNVCKKLATKKIIGLCFAKKISLNGFYIKNIMVLLSLTNYILRRRKTKKGLFAQPFLILNFLFEFGNFFFKFISNIDKLIKFSPFGIY